MLSHLPTLPSMFNTLDLPRQVAYGEHVFTQSGGDEEKGPSLWCFLLHESARRVPATGVSPKEAVVLEN